LIPARALRVLVAAGAYFALVFGAGVVFGVLRETFLTPWIGPDASRIAELPVMMAVSWVAALLVVARIPGLSRLSWAWVGILAFAMLMIAEFLLGIGFMRMNPRAVFMSFMTVPGMISLAAQALLLVFPAMAAAYYRRQHG
jgi:hypothetical protein